MHTKTLAGIGAAVVLALSAAYAVPSLSPGGAEEPLEGQDIIIAAGLIRGICHSTNDEAAVNGGIVYLAKEHFSGDITQLDCISPNKDIDFMLENCDANGANCTDMLAAEVTCPTTGVSIVIGEFSEPMFEMNDWLRVSYTVMGGAAANVTFSFCGLPSIGG